MDDQKRMRQMYEARALYCAGWAWDARRRGLLDLAATYERVAREWRAKAMATTPAAGRRVRITPRRESR